MIRRKRLILHGLNRVRGADFASWVDSAKTVVRDNDWCAGAKPLMVLLLSMTRHVWRRRYSLDDNMFALMQLVGRPNVL